MSTPIPESFRATVAGRKPDARGAGPGGPVSGDAWLARLPSLLADRLAAWELAPDGDAWHGECALVVPVRRASGERAALKLTWPHAEAALEHLALRHWDGDGAVRLLAADPASWALLLERLDGDRDLRGVSVLEACEEIGTLFTRLDRPAAPQFTTAASHTERWRRDLLAGTPLVPRRMTQQAASELASLLVDPPTNRLVHTDLHDANVLAPLDAGRGAWVAIDPKPLATEWAFAVAPIVWNRADEAARAHSLRAHLRLRADIVTDVAGLDEDRVRAWTHVRLVLNAVDAAAHAPASDAFRARMIALAKAFAS
ncbi:aminoglycoside phosphotransferase family protein [Propioniciclava soli]|uniref:Aminoglycoside phosphotransferase family protein n=1 Tax=Propioniciclava soli TaxID=2775081 RepID=A0ABZ3C752_9ACTN